MQSSTVQYLSLICIGSNCGLLSKVSSFKICFIGLQNGLLNRMVDPIPTLMHPMLLNFLKMR